LLAALQKKFPPWKKFCSLRRWWWWWNSHWVVVVVDTHPTVLLLFTHNQKISNCRSRFAVLLVTPTLYHILVLATIVFAMARNSSTKGKGNQQDSGKR
jgi:hypothetical protein